MKKYRVVFMRIVVSEREFKERMSHLGVSMSASEMIIEKAPVILKEGMTLRSARRYADAIQRAGGLVKLREQGFFKASEKFHDPLQIEPLESFTMCPQCGYKQLKAEICVKCGFYISGGETRRESSI
jgi:ribosomal protein L32